MKAFLALGAVMVLLGAGCTTTVQRTAEQSPVICGFLGADLCAELQPGAKEEAGLRYVNPKGMFTQYDKVMIVVVGFFGGDPARYRPRTSSGSRTSSTRISTRRWPSGTRSWTRPVPG